jgi:hypothetical protein
MKPSTCRSRRVLKMVAVAILVFALFWAIGLPNGLVPETVFASPIPIPSGPEAVPTPDGFVGPEGGIFRTDDTNFEVRLPQGYLPHGAVLTAWYLPKAQQPSVRGFRVVGSPICFAIWVNGESMDQFPTTLTLIRRNYPTTSLKDVKEKNLQLAFYDQSARTWREVPSQVDLKAREVTAEIAKLRLSNVCDSGNKQLLVAVVGRLPTPVPSRTLKPTSGPSVVSTRSRATATATAPVSATSAIPKATPIPSK